MKKNLIIIVMLLAVSTYFSACKKKDDLNTPLIGLGGDTYVKGAIDEWIGTNLTTAYNMEIKYKWDRSELGNINKDVVPIAEDKVIPVLETVRSGWIEPYVIVKGADFMKKYIQKQIYMAGSAQYNSNGTKTLGTAEAGRKVTLMVLNDFVKGEKGSVRNVLHTTHHEFGHILNQNIAVTSDYQRISAGDYNASWNNIERPDALSKGFISPYAMSSKDEDFVEMLSVMLVSGEAAFQQTIDSLYKVDGGKFIRDAQGAYQKNDDARTKLLKKKDIVVSYLKSAFGIDFAQLQSKVQDAIEISAPTPDFNILFGSNNNIYNTIYVNPQLLTSQSASFLKAFSEASSSLQLSKGAYIEDIDIVLSSNTQMIIAVNYKSSSSALSASNSVAKFSFNITNVNGLIAVRNDVPLSPQTVISYQNIQTLLDYFKGQAFNTRWVDDIVPQSKGVFGGFVKTNDPASYVLGTFNKL